MRPHSFTMRSRREWLVAGARSGTTSVWPVPIRAATSSETPASVANESVDASKRIAAEDEPVPNAETVAVAESVVKPRPEKAAMPSGGCGSSVVTMTGLDAPVSPSLFWPVTRA